MRLNTLPLLCALLLPSIAFADPEPGEWKTIDLNTLPTLDAIAPGLVEKRVVYVGETHDAYEEHLVQLAILKRLHRAHPDLALGVEYFQQPFQPVLDRYVAGEIDENTLLLQSEYFDRWRYDWRLYRPIFEYAREHRIPIIALNVAAELHRKVAEGGIAALDEEERAKLPEIDRGDLPYRERLMTIFQQHPGAEEKRFEHFYEAQLVWDEAMAERAAEWLKAHPERPLLVLAGSGHIQSRAGIPSRVARRVDASSAVVLNGAVAGLSPEVADYVVLPPEIALPPPGRLGIMMELRDGGVFVADFDDQSPARQAGVEKGDRLVSVAGRPVATLADVRVAMWDKGPGEVVEIETERAGLFGGNEAAPYRVPLH